MKEVIKERFCKKFHIDRIVASALAMILMVELLPHQVFALSDENSVDGPRFEVTNPEAKSPESTGGLYLDKDLKLNDDKTGEIVLETYVEGAVKGNRVPLDIVLVLDQSGSMRGNNIKALKSSAKKFVEEVKKQNNGVAESEKHRIAVVGFSNGPKGSSGDSNKYKGTGIYTVTTADNGYVNYSELENNTSSEYYKNALVTPEYTGVGNVTSAIDKLDTYSKTRTDLGLEIAKNILANNRVEGRNQVVVMFTDGEPNDSNSKLSAEATANLTIPIAKEIKKTAKIYTVGLFDKGFNKENNKKIENKFMNYTSSNYESAESLANPGEGKWNGKYYTVASDEKALNEIFVNIRQDVQKIDLGKDTVVKDVLANHFKVNGDVKVYESKYTGKNSQGEAQFGEKVNSSATASVLNGVVSVSGFDFEPVIDKEGNTKSGKKLTIVIPVKLEDSAFESQLGNAIPSNNKPGNVSAVVSSDGTSFEFNVPTVKIPNEKIVITAESLTKVYDGQPLNAAKYSVTGENFLKEGDVLTATVNGSQKNAGSSASVISSYKIMRGEEDVTDEYYVVTVQGLINIEKRPVTIVGKSDSVKFNGSEQKVEGYTVAQPTEATGLLEGHVLSGVKHVAKGKSVGEHEGAFSGKIAIKDASQNNVTSNYDITKTPGKLVIGKGIMPADAVNAEGFEKVYDGKTHTIAITNKIGAQVKYTVDGVKASPSAKDVEDSQSEVTVTFTHPDYEPKTVKVKKIIKPRNVTISSETKTKAYDGTPIENGAVSSNGFVEGEGIKATFTDAARDVVDVTTTPVPNDFNYKAKLNTNLENYIITKNVGNLSITVAEDTIVVTANSNKKTYDGTPLTDSGYSFDKDLLKGDDVLVATVEGSQTDASDVAAENKVTSVKIMCGERDVTSNYNIRTVSGELKVNPIEIELKSVSAEKDYDGTPLTAYEVNFDEDLFADGEGFIYDFSGSQLEPGTSKNEFTYSAKNDNTKLSNYDVTVVFGDLKVNKARITLVVEAESADKTYDGEPLTNDKYMYNKEAINSLHELVVEVEGSALNVSEEPVENKVASVKIMRGEKDVTDNFKIETVSGELVIKPREIVITSEDATRVYNGKPLTNEKASISGEGFVGNEGVKIEFTGKVTNVYEGEKDNEFKYEFKKNTLPENYVIESDYGKLSITPATLTVKAENKSKLQGDENPELTAVITGFVNKEKAEDVLVGEAKLSTTANKDSQVGKYVIKAEKGTLSSNENYVFEFEDGELEVTAKPVPAPIVPDTGDTTNTGLYLGMSAVAVIGLIVVFIIMKKNNKK